MTISFKQQQPKTVAYSSDCFVAFGREWNIMTHVEGMGSD